jgi:uncharacterized glyoxalase superfamily protein PhnB
MNAALKINLGYWNAPAAIKFLVQVLGFEQGAVYTAATDELIAHAEFKWPGGGTVTLHSTDPGKNSVADLTERATKDGGYPAFSFHLDTDTPEIIYNRARKAGAKIIREMKSSPMGTGFIVADPEGMYWSVGTPLPRLVRNAQGQWQPEV